MADLKLIIFVESGMSSPHAYFSSEERLVEILSTTSSPHDAYIYELSLSNLQTPNPFGGARLKEPVVIIPAESAKSYLQNYLHQWDGMSKEQASAEAARAQHSIKLHLDKFLSSIKQEEESPQTEVIIQGSQPSNSTEGIQESDDNHIIDKLV